MLYRCIWLTLMSQIKQRRQRIYTVTRQTFSNSSFEVTFSRCSFNTASILFNIATIYNKSNKVHCYQSAFNQDRMPTHYPTGLWCRNPLSLCVRICQQPLLTKYIAITVYPKKYAHGFCFAVLCCGYTLTDFPISIRLTSLALWQSNDYHNASKATLMNMDKNFMWIHYDRLHNHNKAKHNKTVCIFLGIYCNYRRKKRKRVYQCVEWLFTSGNQRQNLESAFVSISIVASLFEKDVWNTKVLYEEEKKKISVAQEQLIIFLSRNC